MLLPSNKLVVAIWLATSGTLACRAEELPTTPPAVSSGDQLLAESLASIVRESIPREYARKKNWGHTKRITTGVTSDGPVYKLKLHRKKKHVRHGTWKQYRVRFIEPEEQLRVSVENMHSLEGAGVGLRLVVEAELAGWAQMRHYNRGIHLLTLTAEGTSRLKLAIDCEVRMQATAKGMVLDPVVTRTNLDLKKFELQRFGELEGELAKQLGDGLLYLMQDQLESKRLTAKLNRAIDKKRDRLVLSPF